MKNFVYLYILFLTFALFNSCSSENNDNVNNTERGQSSLYFNGDIITMEGESPEYAAALVERDGKILFVGNEAEAREKAGNTYNEIDLKGKTLVPGFIDGHAHFYGFGAQAVTANLLANPDGTCDSIPALISTLKKWHEENGTSRTNGWIVGMGFDDAVLAEKRFPTREDLDKVSTEIPVMAIHISGHFCAVNSKGLEEMGITAETENPDGGVIRRIKGTKEPNGVLEELAAIPNMIKLITPTDPEVVDYYINKGQDMAVSFGYTTAVEGRAMTNHEQLADYADQGKFKIDVLSYVDYMFPQYMDTEWNSREYKNHYRIGGLKLTLDGSPQGRTAWRTTPYLIPPEGQNEDYSGYPAIPEDDKVKEIVNMAFANNWQLKTHCNGDAAFDQLCRALGPAVAKFGNNDRRNVLIHGQLIRADQIDSLKKYDLVASLFPMHTFYWGDWYDEIIGPDNAQKISPIKSALNNGIHVTSHTDAPVALPNLMMIMWTTVNRVSRSGKIMGPDERLTPYEALQSFTIGGAYQFFEENEKGSFKAGKIADMVVLDQNPLEVDPMTLKDIKVLQTIKDGKTVYTSM